MKLGEFIADYRCKRNLSQRQFANQCGLSNSYISLLEKGENPKTGKPITPDIERLKIIASAMSMPLHELILSVDDMQIALSEIALPPAHQTSLPTNYREIPQSNILRLAGRDGSYHERTLTDQQMAAIKAILDQMPDVPDDL